MNPHHLGTYIRKYLSLLTGRFFSSGETAAAIAVARPPINRGHIMIQLLDDFISQLYDEFPLPRLASNSTGDYTSRLICQLNARRNVRNKTAPPSIMDSGNATVPAASEVVK